MTAGSHDKATYGQVLAEPQFRVLFVARVLGVVADSLRSVALSVMVYAATQSPALGALAFSIGFLPQALGGALLGALADRFPARALIAGGYGLQAVTGLLLAHGHLPIAAELVLVGAVACATPLFSGASSRLIADLLTGDAYVLGRSLSYLAAVGAQLLGLAGGGVAIAAWGAVDVMLGTSLLHLSAALIVRLFLPRGLRVRSAVRFRSLVKESWEGNRALMAEPVLRRLYLIHWLPAGFVAAAESLVIPYSAERTFGPARTGLLLACLPIGMLAADLAVGRLLPPAVRERLVVPLVILLAVPLTMFAWRLPLGAVAVLFLLSGCGFSYLLGLQRTFLEAIPEQRRGLGFALLNTGTMTTQGLGPALFGGLAELLPVGTVIAVAGGACLATSLVVLARRISPPRGDC